jgi:cupin fold WbuC family metalloprotein
MKVFARTLLDELATKATVSPRARAHLNLHASPSDLVQRFFVTANRNSYFRPHCHATKSELALVVRGGFDVITFDADGKLTARYAVGEGTPNMAYETPPGTWHTLVAKADGSAFLEVKEGPYDPTTASEFAAWTPAEGHDSTAAMKFLEWVRTAQPGEVAPAV